MVLIMLVHKDGGYCKGPIVDESFDVQVWAKSRRAAFDLLQVVRVETIAL